MKVNKKTTKKIKYDKLLRVSQAEDELDYVGNENWPQDMVLSGNMDLGRNGNPVTIYLEDEVTGEQLEISGVKNAFLIVEDMRRTTSGWLALAVGSVEKVGDVLGFLSQTTLETLKKLARRG